MDNYNPDPHIRTGYASPAPYPPVSVTEPNLRYATLLMDDYAGAVSELTAVNQHLYHNFIIGQTDDSIAKMLENIAIVEMRHLEMLADTILLLGGQPRVPRQLRHVGQVLERKVRVLRHRYVRPAQSRS